MWLDGSPPTVTRSGDIACARQHLRMPAAPSGKDRLTFKRLRPAVHAVEICCHGNVCEENEEMFSGQSHNAEGKSATVDDNSSLAMADSVPPRPETKAVQTVLWHVRRESRPIAASRKKCTQDVCVVSPL